MKCFWEVQKRLTCCARPRPAAPSLRIDIVPGRIENDAVDIERVIAAIADKPNVAMAVLPDSTTSVNSDLIIALAARHEVFE